MPINPDYQFEKILLKSIENKEGKIEKKESSEKKQQDKEPAQKTISISPKDAHGIALILIKNKKFKNKLKEYVAESIVHGQNITRLDVVIEKKNNQQLLDTYGLTKEHFQNISNGNLTSFDLAADGSDLAIYFKRATGEPAIRPIDNEKLAIMINLILNTQPEMAQDLQSDIELK